MPATGPEQARPSGHLDRGVGIRLDEVVQCGAYVGVGRRDPRVPGDLPVTEPTGLRLGQHGGEVLGVEPGEGALLTEFREPHGAVLAQRVEHPVTLAHLLENRLVDQPLHQPRDVVGDERTARADGLRVGQVQGTAEDGQPGPQQPLQRGAQLMAPADRRTKRPMPSGPHRLVHERVQP